jgi:hypothetical protein
MLSHWVAHISHQNCARSVCVQASDDRADALSKQVEHSGLVRVLGDTQLTNMLNNLPLGVRALDNCSTCSNAMASQFLNLKVDGQV